MDNRSPRFLSAQPVSSDRVGPSSVTGGRFHRPMRPLKPRQSAEIPNRYLIKEDERGRYLTCVEAPELKARIERGLSVTATAARKAPEGTIYLDGAAQAPPFLDLERRVYNLDHHEGCVRPFTLSTCEQALMLVVRGLDVREKPWEIHANSPDLDTVLALWVLLNSMHLHAPTSPIREAAIPLVRLEGVIDAHGLELAELTGFPVDFLAETRRQLDRLRDAELAHGEEQTSAAPDALDHVCDQLQALDRMIYPTDFFEAFRGIEELAKEELTDNRIAVVCRCDCGIYELERDLKRLYGKRLGVIVLQKGEGSYTLRQVDPFLAVNLESAYRKLNMLDPAVKASGSADRWGGSGEIGGSPRRSGTGLSPVDIAEALRLAYRRPTVLDRARSVGSSIVLSSVPMVAGWTACWLAAGLDRSPRSALVARPLEFLSAAGLAVLVVLLTAGRRGRYRVFGLHWPEGRWWALLTPLVLTGGVGGGAWLLWPVSVAALLPHPGGMVSWISLLGFPLLAELAFRGLAHGALVHNFSVQHSEGRWFLSWPVAVSSLLYALWTLPLLELTLAAAAWPQWLLYMGPLGALICGLGLGVARERSGSLLVALALHYLAVAATLVTGWVLG